MFDSVLLPGNAPRRRLGAGTTITVLLHVGLVALTVWLSSRPVEEVLPETDVKFFAAPPPPPPPPPPAGGSAPKVEKKVEKKPKKPQEIIQPKEIPQEKPPEVEPEPQAPTPEEPVPGGMEGGVEGGVEGGTVGGVVGGVVGGTLGGTGEVLSFGEGMTRPVNAMKPPSFTCPREAKEANISGVVIASCTLMPDGRLRNCKILKPVPFMEEVVLDLLHRWEIGPIYFQGRPVTVNYKPQIRISCR